MKRRRTSKAFVASVSHKATKPHLKHYPDGWIHMHKNVWGKGDTQADAHAAYQVAIIDGTGFYRWGNQ